MKERSRHEGDTNSNAHMQRHSLSAVSPHPASHTHMPVTSKPILNQVKFNGRTTHPTNPHIQPPLLTQCPSQASQHPASPSRRKHAC
ncbi:hypothetical protein CgunFtcFv8_026914 [Champsocephalus gunnari]|uniref:Uncharacterized protein n=1 Tax=Champsocephalus gunnari TaxID=52237 RepID=A0AAN8HW94_CHAGU|nr:hypothetical protein CgunFtcFv8_026914 [Champsocephalus gunnari]